MAGGENQARASDDDDDGGDSDVEQRLGRLSTKNGASPAAEAAGKGGAGSGRATGGGGASGSGGGRRQAGGAAGGDNPDKVGSGCYTVAPEGRINRLTVCKLDFELDTAGQQTPLQMCTERLGSS